MRPTPLLIVAILVIASNLAGNFVMRKQPLTSLPFIRVVIIFDVLLLTYLLYAYGGYTNPFGMIYIVHVILASLLLGGMWTWLISAVSSIGYLFVFFYYIPIPELEGHHHHMHGAAPNLHLQGMYVAFVLIAGLVSSFVQKMRSEIEWRERALAKQKLNYEKLADITTVAASAAHELGTPLGTMQLTIDELKGIETTPELQNTLEPLVKILDSQIERCSTSLHNLIQSSGELSGEMPSTILLEDLRTALAILESQDTLLFNSSRVKFVTEWDGTPSMVLPKAALLHVFRSLVKNALEASEPALGVTVELLVPSDQKMFELRITDQGPGIPAEILAMLGEPFVSSKKAQGGMGLGIFIASLFARRCGGDLQFKSGQQNGTIVSLRLPLHLSISGHHEVSRS